MELAPHISKDIVTKDLNLPRDSFVSDVRLVHRSINTGDEASHARCQLNQSSFLTVCRHRSSTTACVLPVFFKTRPEQKEVQLFNPHMAQEMYSLPNTIASTYCCQTYPACTHLQTHQYHAYPPTKHVYATKMVSELKIVADGYSAWYKNPSILKRSLPELILDWPKHWHLDQVV